MLKLVRVLLLLVIALVLGEAVTGVVSATTGFAEKAIIVLVAAALMAVLPRVWRLGAPHAP
jgi:ABC-type molybdate transport system substrate-binding protein